MSITFFEAICMGIVQGLAEFLPVSSSGHLLIAQNLFNITDVPMLFNIVLHLATLAALIAVFYRKIWELLCACGRFVTRKSLDEDGPRLKMICAIIVATIATGAVGLLIEKYIAQYISVKIVGALLIVTAALLIASSLWRPKKNADCPGAVQGLFTGLAQGIGVLPGISRSGITISAAVFAGVSRETAGEFSFLLSIPAVLGAFILEFKDAELLLRTAALPQLASAAIAAFITGFFSLKFLLTLIKKGRLGLFAFYLIPVGALCIIFL